MPIGEFIEITVSDNGIGIEEKDKTKILKSDFNESKPGTANEKGSGLGLVICKRFVERNQGKIWIENKIEKGSTFKFTLPMYKEDMHKQAEIEVVKSWQ
jgi:signal transduction histidine kinase